MSPDPFWPSYNLSNPQSFNRYAYSLNNPVSSNDPLGLMDSDYACTYTYAYSYDANGNINGITGVNQVCDQIQASDEVPTGGFSVPATVCDGTDNNMVGGRCTNSQPFVISTPNNATPWYKNPCVQKALAKGAATTALDAIGTLPEGGTISAAFSLFNGAAGVSNGAKIWGRAAFAGGLISTAGAAHDLQGPQESALSTTVTGFQAVAGGAGIAKGLIEDIPVAGQVFAGISVGFDILGTAVEVYNCHP